MYRDIFEEKCCIMLSSSKDTKKNSNFQGESTKLPDNLLKITPSKSVEGLSNRILIQNGADWLNEDVHGWISCQLILIKASLILTYIHVDRHEYR